MTSHQGHSDWETAFQDAFNGNRSPLDAMINIAFQETLLPYISSRAKSYDDAKEIANISILKFWERFFVIQEPLPNNVEAYLYTMGQNALFRFYKIKKKQRPYEMEYDVQKLRQVLHLHFEENLGEGELSHKESLFKAMEIGLNKMCDSCKSIIKMNIFEKKKLKDIYLKLGFPSSNAASKKKVKCINKLIKYSFSALAAIEHKSKIS